MQKEIVIRLWGLTAIWATVSVLALITRLLDLGVFGLLLAYVAAVLLTAWHLAAIIQRMRTANDDRTGMIKSLLEKHSEIVLQKR